MKKILIPTDGSEAALNAAKNGMDLLGKEAKVFAVSIVRKSSPQQRKDRAEKNVEEICSLAEEKGLECEGRVLKGNAVRQIVDFADIEDVDYIVMGTTGKDSISEYFVGSTTQRVLYGTDKPVISVPLPSKEKLMFTREAGGFPGG